MRSFGLLPSAGARNPTIYKVSIPDAGTEVEIILTGETKRLSVVNSSDGVLRLSFASGESSDGLPVDPFTAFSEDAILYTGNLYVQNTKAAQVVYVVQWV